FWTTHQEGDVIHFIYNPASCRRSRGSFAGTDSLESSDQARKHGRRRNGNVVGAEDHLYLRRKGCESADRGSIGFQIGFGTVYPDGSRIVCIARKEQPVGAFEERDRVWRVTRRGDDFQRSTAEIDSVTVMRVRRDLPGPG